MSEQDSTAPEESFISHLVELRDRLLRSLVAVGVVLGILCIYPGPGAIYDILAAPLTAALPEGTKMVAIGVITPFMVPLKVTAMVASYWRCRSSSIRRGPSSRRACTRTRSGWAFR